MDLFHCPMGSLVDFRDNFVEMFGVIEIVVFQRFSCADIRKLFKMLCRHLFIDGAKHSLAAGPSSSLSGDQGDCTDYVSDVQLSWVSMANCFQHGFRRHGSALFFVLIQFVKARASGLDVFLCPMGGLGRF